MNDMNDRNGTDAYVNAYGVGGANAAAPAPDAQATEPVPSAQPARAAAARPVRPVPAYADPAPAAPVAAPVMAAPVQKKSHGWIVGIVVVVCIFLFMLISMLSCSATVGSLFSSAGMYSSEDALAELHEPAIGVIELNGTIQYDGSACSPDGLQYLLERAENDDDIRGVLLKVNSGGGVATAGEEMAALVRDFPKPIVVASQATCASAAYEISSQADYIFTDRTTTIGAIGVIMSVTDLSGLYDKLGISIENIKSADSKDAGAGNRPLTEEERAWYQSMVDQINDVFIETVAEGRDMSIEEVRALANGLPYLGMDAVDNGLADEVGNADDAIAYLSGLLGYDRPLPAISLMSRSSELSDLLDLLGSNGDELDAQRLADLLKKTDGGNVVQQ